MKRSEESVGLAGRLSVAAGAAWVVCILVGNSLTESGAPTEDTGEAALEYFGMLQDGSHLLGISLELAGFCLLAVFLGRLYSVLRGAEGPDGWWAGVALIGGVTTLAVKLATVAPGLVGVAALDSLSPDQAEVLLLIGEAGFLVSAMTSGLLILGAAASALTSHLLPRPVAWAGMPIGLLAILGSLRPTSLEGNPGILGFLLGLLWLGSVSLLLALRGTLSAPAAGREAVLSQA